MRGGQRCSRESWKKLLRAVRQNSIVTAKRKVQLTLCQGKKKGHEVEDEDYDDVVRTSVSQGRVCTEELFPFTQYIYNSLPV